MKAGETWKDLTSGALGTIEKIEGDFVVVRFHDGGMCASFRRETLLDHWTRWPRKLDLETQEQLRKILRANQVDIPPEILVKPINVLSLYPITGGIGSQPNHVRQEADRNARTRPWAIDIGTYKGGLNENQAGRIKTACEEEGIPFWDKQWTSTYQVLKNPNTFPQQHAEICETFGAPIPALVND